MRKNYLLEIGVNQKTLKVDDLAKVTDHAIGIHADKVLTAMDTYFAHGSSFNIEIKNVFKVNEKIYATCNDGYLYEKVGLDFVKKFSIGEKTPIMDVVILNGLRETLYLDEKVGCIVDKDGVQIGLPYGNHFATYSLRCFSASENTIYFSSPFDFCTKSMMLDNLGNFSIKKEDGKIIGLYDFSNYLLIVCDRAFYKLTIVDDEFNLEKINVDSYVIEQKSLAKIREKLLFVADGKLCVYENYTVKEKPCIYAKYILDLDFKATTKDDYYYCQVKIPDKTCVLAYDVVKQTSVLLYVIDSVMAYENVGINLREGRFYSVTNTTIAPSSKWRSVAMNFGSNEKKSLLEVSIKVTKDSLLKISGDFGYKIYNLKEGINKKTMNLSSKEFVFDLDCVLKNLIVSDLQLKYVV